MSYETEHQTNQRLFRNLKSGKEYETLIPKSNCKRIDGGKGNTSYSVDQMAQVVDKYYDQMAKVAKKLKSSSLKNTCQNIQEFAYWNFQYKLDMGDQLLRSPACSFASRVDGIDCKSYSIIVASILQNLGIKSYFRRVTYRSDKPYSHVYNVIPKDQKTGSLANGYYVIDGTINLSVETEPYYFTKQDKLMELDHFILNAPPKGLGNSTLPFSNYELEYARQRGVSQAQLQHIAKAQRSGLGADWVDSGMDIIGSSDSGFLKGVTDFFKDFNISSIISQIGCLGGSGFTDSAFKPITELLIESLNADIKGINTYLGKIDGVTKIPKITIFGKANGFTEVPNKQVFANLVRSTFLKYLWYECLYEERKRDDWNSCSTENFNVPINFLKYNIGAVLDALGAWLDKNFDTETDTSSLIKFEKARGNFNQIINGKDLHFSSAGPEMWIDETGASKLGSNVWYRGVTNRYSKYARKRFNPKKGATIPFFEITDDLKNFLTNPQTIKGNSGKFNIQKFVTDLVNTATIFQGGLQPGGNQNTGGNGSNENGSGTNYTSDTAGASPAKMAGVVLLLAGAGYAITQFKNKPNKTTK